MDTRTPGVYVQEVSIFPPSVTSVATAIPAFIGYTEVDPGKAVRITSMNDFVANFGGPHKAVSMTPAGVATISANKFCLFYSMQLYFANGGGPCYVISLKAYPSSPVLTDWPNAWNDGAFKLLSLEDEPTLIVMPDLRLIGTSGYVVYVSALEMCNRLQDRFVIIDPLESPSAVNCITNLRTGVGSQNLKYGAAYYPDLVTTLSYPNEAIVFTGTSAISTTTDTLATVLAGNVATKIAEWITMEKAVRATLATLSISLPPSAAIAGIYASVDRARGVWKAPANVSLNGVVKPSLTVTNEDQLDLNVPPNGKAVNAIRAFTGKGNLVWGARTLAGNDNEWRYVSVRRLFIMVEESVRKATEWVVFEPNDANTWLKVKTMIENYLLNLWKDGALAGAVPKDAFFVKVGLNQTMTAQDILNGYMYVEIGMAAVRPAEFVVLKFSHKLQES